MTAWSRSSSFLEVHHMQLFDTPSWSLWKCIGRPQMESYPSGAPLRILRLSLHCVSLLLSDAFQREADECFVTMVASPEGKNSTVIFESVLISKCWFTWKWNYRRVTDPTKLLHYRSWYAVSFLRKLLSLNKSSIWIHMKRQPINEQLISCILFSQVTRMAPMLLGFLA